MKVNIYLPGLPVRPGGGFKVMYEYANQFALNGYNVKIYNILTNPYWSHWMRPAWLRIMVYNLCFPNYRPRWFKLDKTIKCRNIPRLSEKYVRDADVSLSTNWAITFELNALSTSKGKKINLIQDYELWIGNNKKMLHASYRLPIIQVVIADHLASIIEKENGRAIIIYNAVDVLRFYIKLPMEKRNHYSVSMLFSIDERKGTQYGFDALRICKKEIPDLYVELFGVYKKPTNLEEWMHYTRQPKDLCTLYNTTAIFFTPSNNEGWGLPATEAMHCGCALVCTNVGGHTVFAKHDKTALLVEPRNPQDMAEKLVFLLKNNEERKRIAYNGNIFVKRFSWTASFRKLELILQDKT